MTAEYCGICGKTDSPAYTAEVCKRCFTKTPEYLAQIRAKWRDLRMQVLVAYSQNPPSCKCCSETINQFLSIDHIDGCGLKLRKVERSGTPLYIYLKARNFPKGYQVLCHNCNGAKGFYGLCPHQQK